MTTSTEILINILKKADFKIIEIESRKKGQI